MKKHIFLVKYFLSLLQLQANPYLPNVQRCQTPVVACMCAPVFCAKIPSLPTQEQAKGAGAGLVTCLRMRGGQKQTVGSDWWTSGGKCPCQGSEVRLVVVQRLVRETQITAAYNKVK